MLYRNSLLVTVAGLLFVLPISLGLLATWLPAIGYLPGLKGSEFSSNALQAVFSHPSTYSSLILSVSSALIATLSAFLLSQWLCMSLYRSRLWPLLKHSIAPLLAIPHLAFSVGLVFLIAPSGWFMRLLSPTLTGFEIPPDWLIVNDNYALSLSVGLMLKEIPFFILMTLSALSHFDHRKTLLIAASLHYSHVEAWVKLIFPQIYAQLRLPLYAVLSYSLSVVDVALVLGPNAPATFAVLINQWFNHSDMHYRLLGAAGASVMLMLVVVLIVLIYTLEIYLKKRSKQWLVAGPKLLAKRDFTAVFAKIILYVVLLLSFFSLLNLFVWSISRQWRFPDAWPSRWSLKYWEKSWQQLIEPLQNTAIIGVSSALLALVICIVLLQYQSTFKIPMKRSWWQGLLYLPILVPQISFLFGIQVLLVRFNLEGGIASVIWVHLIFVLPYAYLTLSQVYLQFDDRYLQQATILCQSKWRAFVLVKLVMLFKPIAFSFAVAFAVSVAQYLPSLYVGAGRVNTITLESVALASGSDARVSAVFALWQFMLPLFVYIAAIVVPQMCFRNRREL